MKRQTVILSTFLIAVFAAATILTVVSTSQHPIALTEKSMAATQNKDQPYLPTPYLPTPTPEPLPTPYIPTPEPTPTPSPSPSPTP